MRRKPEVPEGEVPVEECFDGHGRITSKELAPIHSVKNGILQNACSRVREWMQIWWKVLLCASPGWMKNSLAKGPKKNDDKSAVAILKKNDLHESVWQLVVNRDNSHERPERLDVKRDACHELKQGPVGRRSSNALQLGCVFHEMKPPKSILRKSSDMQKPIQRVKFTKSIARHTKIRDKNPSLGMICPGELHQRSPNVPKFEDRSWGSVSGRDRVARVRCPRSSVEAGQKCIKIKGEKQSNILLTFGK